MCKSTTPLFLLVFAIAWGIETPSWWVGCEAFAQRHPQAAACCCPRSCLAARPLPLRRPGLAPTCVFWQEPGGGGVGHFCWSAAAGVWRNAVSPGGRAARGWGCAGLGWAVQGGAGQRVDMGLWFLEGGGGSRGQKGSSAAARRVCPGAAACPSMSTSSLPIHISPWQVGFILVMTAAMLAGLRWTITQVLLQGGPGGGHGERGKL